MSCQIPHTTARSAITRFPSPAVLLLGIVAAVLAVATVKADEIYAVDSSGRERLSRSKVIVHTHSPRKSADGWETIAYWIFERGALQLSNDMNRDGTRYRVVKSALPERQEIVAQWLQRKRRAVIVDNKGQGVDLADPTISLMDPPGKESSIGIGGGLVLFGEGREQNHFELITGGQNKRIDFSSLQKMVFNPGGLVATLADGTNLIGTLKPTTTDRGVTLDAAIQGLRVSKEYDIERITIRVKEINEVTFRQN